MLGRGIMPCRYIPAEPGETSGTVRHDALKNPLIRPGVKSILIMIGKSIMRCKNIFHVPQSCQLPEGGPLRFGIMLKKVFMTSTLPSCKLRESPANK